MVFWTEILAGLLRDSARFPCLNSQGQWQPSFTYFRTVPPASVWTDLYNDVPPKGDYVLDMGCDNSFRLGQIRFIVQ